MSILNRNMENSVSNKISNQKFESDENYRFFISGVILS